MKRRAHDLAPRLSTAPAVMEVSRAGRKRAATMKAFQAQQACKRGTEQAEDMAVAEATDPTEEVKPW